MSAHMYVKDLINELQKVKPHALVFFKRWSDPYEDPIPISKVENHIHNEDGEEDEDVIYLTRE